MSEDLNKNEEENKLEGEVKEPTQDELGEMLRGMIRGTIDKIGVESEVNKEVLKKLKELLANTPSFSQETFNEVLEIEKSMDFLTRTTEANIEAEGQETSIDHIKNYNPDSAEAKVTKIVKAPEKIQKRFDDNEKIHPKMKEAMAVVCAGVFNNCEYPYTLIGSNCYIPHTEYSAKIPDDLDVIFGIKDYKNVIKNLKKLQGMGLVKGLKEEDVLKTDGTKGDKKIHCWVKGGPNDEWVEMEAFAQNMVTQTNEGKVCESYIPLGINEEEIEVIEVSVMSKDKRGKVIKNEKGEIVYEKVKVNIGSEKMARELYLKNIIKEFNLYNKNGWEHKAMLNAKALQRIFNLINMDSEGTEQSINNLMDEIARIEPKTETIRKVRDSLVFLWEQFKSLPINKQDESAGQQKGLVDYINEINKKEINSNQEDPEKKTKEEKVLATESAVDIITKETNFDLDEISTRSKKLKLKYEGVLGNESASKEDIEGAIDDINKERRLLIQTGIKYKNYISIADSKNRDDFCVYAAMPMMRYHFILPYSVELVANKIRLIKKLEKLRDM